MVRYEFKEGASSKFWAIELNNTEFTVCYGKIGTAGQKQTKSFASAEQAKKEHDKLVAEKIKKGYQRAGGEIPASPPPSAPVSKSSEAVLRKDYHVYNEATGFAITSKRLGGKGIDGGSKEWMKAVKNGDLIPIELVQDDAFNIRVIVGGGLNAQEADEWVGRLDWKLRVPDGNLVVCGGSEYVMEEFEGEESDYMKEYVRHISIPRGEYRATIYMYMNSVNGKSCMMAARGGDEPDPLGEWFRRTHPGKDFPAWLHNECVSDPREDPGHEKEWKKAKRKDDPNENYIDFVLHLTPLDKSAKVAIPKINSDSDDGGDGWFSNPNECRVPERMPLGLVAVDLDRLKSDEDGPHEDPSVDIFKHTANEKYALKAVNGTVEVPLEKLNRLYRLGWFCHSWSMPQVAISPANRKTIEVPSKAVENIRWRKDGERLIVDFVPNGRQSGGLTALGAAFAELKDLPDGTEIELDCANASGEDIGSAKPQGLHRYKGVVTSGVLRVTEAYPVADAKKLNAALALSEQAEKGPLIDAGSEEIAAAVFESLKKHPFFDDNKPVKKGTALGQKKFELLMLNVIAGEVFTATFKSDWPCFVFEDLDDDEEDEDEDDEDEDDEPLIDPVASKGKKVPIRIETFLKGAGRRSYFTANIEALDANAKKAIKEYEAELLPMGFAHVADIGCSATGDLVIRSYAQPGGTTWAVLMLAQFGRTVPEFFDTFEGGATLTTTRNGMAVREELFREAFKSIWPQAKVKDMWTDHQKRAEFLAQHHGARKKVEPSAAGIAGDVETFLEMQENQTARLKVLLRGKDRHSVYEADGSKIHPDAGRVLQEADAAMEKLGFKPVGDVTHSFLCALLLRGYARPGGDTWAVFHLDCSTAHPPQGRWDFSTYFEKGAVLQSTRFAMSKDEQKRKIFRILYPGNDVAEMLGLHEKRKDELIKKWGPPQRVQADLGALAKEAERSVERMIGS